MKDLSNQFKDPLNLILTVLIAVSLLGTWAYVKETPGLDFYVAWAAADAVNNDTPNNIYKPESRYRLTVIYKNKADERQDNPRQKTIARHRESLPMTATPFMYWVTGLLITGDYEQDLTTWQALSLFLLAVSILVMCRTLNFSFTTSMIILLPVLNMMVPLLSELRVANVNSIQLGMVALILWLQSRSTTTRYLFATGLAIGLLAMFKPNLAPIAFLVAGGWAVRRQFSRLLVTLSGMATAVFFALLVSSWWMGKATIWWDWINVLKHTVGGGGPGRSAGNYSTMTQVSGGMGLNNQFVLALVFCLLCLAALWWGRRNASKSAESKIIEDRELLENTGLVAMGCIVALLASSLVWLHYYVLVIPMIVFALRPWQSSEPMNIWPILMLRVLPVIALVCLLETEIRNLLFDGIDGGTYWAYATMTSAISLFVVGLWQFSYGIRDQRDLS